jgi:hypothetical protein
MLMRQILPATTMGRRSTKLVAEYISCSSGTGKVQCFAISRVVFFSPPPENSRVSGSQPGNALVPAACLNRLWSLNSFGSSVSDVLLWRNRNLSAGILAGATAGLVLNTTCSNAPLPHCMRCLGCFCSSSGRTPRLSSTGCVAMASRLL